MSNNPTYDMLLNLVKTRMSVRKFRPDPIPDDTINKILEVARWAMSGANSQPWEFIVVTDPTIKKQLRVNKAKANWHQAPAVIVVLGDGRRQWGTVMGAHTFGRDQSHLTDGLANACLLIHLAVAALGLTSEWVSIHIEEPHKRILGVPDLLKLYLIIPIGYPDVPARDGVRRPLEEIVHRERYDMTKYMSNEDIVKYLYSLREATVPIHSASRAVTAGEKN